MVLLPPQEQETGDQQEVQLTQDTSLHGRTAERNLYKQ